MKEWGAETKLVLASGWSVSSSASTGRIRTAEGRELALGPHGLLILDAFAEPRTVADAVRRNSALLSGARAWIEMTSAIHRFVDAGVLRPQRQSENERPAATRGFGGTAIHVQMLDDHGRTEAYLRAIAAVVKPGDVVVDLGTGTGILAMAAARAGASRVYAIEESAVADVAEQVFRDNGYDEQIVLLRGHSTRIELPEHADVLVSEIIGHDPLAEQVCEYTSDAVARFLKPLARMVPSALVIHAAAMEARRGDLAPIRAGAAHLRRWRRAYGFDLSALARRSEIPGQRAQIPPAQLARWRMLSQPSEVLRVDLRESGQRRSCLNATVDIVADGRCDAIALWFTATLAPGVSLSTDPRSPRRDNHWWHATWLTGRAPRVIAGEVWNFEIPTAQDQGMTVVRLSARGEPDT